MTLQDEDAKILSNVKNHSPTTRHHIPEDFNPHSTADWEQVKSK
jgi:hypothetical protein